MIHTGHGRRDGADDRILELVHQHPNRATSLVYASDAKLRARLKALGTQVVGSGASLKQIATVPGTLKPTAAGHPPSAGDGADGSDTARIETYRQHAPPEPENASN